MLGAAGTGKSTLANSLLGRDNKYKNDQDGDKQCFEAGKSSSGGKTKDTCAHQGFFLGDGNRNVRLILNPSALKWSLIQLTVVDTPGLGMERIEEMESQRSIVDALKVDVVYVHAFAYLIKSSKNRVTKESKEIMNMYINIFGEDFLKNVIIVATFWDYNGHNLEDPTTEEGWLRDQIDMEFGNLTYGKDLRAVYFTPKSKLLQEADKPKSDEQLTKLYDWASQNEPFECFNINTWKPKWIRAENEIEKLKNEVKEREMEVSKLNDCEAEKKTLTNLTEVLNAKVDKLQEERPKESSVKMAGIAIGCIFGGALLGLLLKRCYKEQCNLAHPDDSDDEDNLKEIRSSRDSLDLEKQRKFEENIVDETEQLRIESANS